MPQSSSAKAIGMPSAMAPRSEPMKMARVMGAALSDVLHRDGGDRGLAELAAVPLGELALQGLQLLLLLRFLDHDEVGLRELAGDGPVKIIEEDEAGRDGEDDADAVEPSGREPGGRRRHVPVDECLLPTAAQEQPGGVEHQQLTQDEAELLARRRQALDEGVDAKMRVLAHGDDGTEEGQPDEQP